MHEAFLKDALVYLVAAGVLVPLFHRARLGAVVGFIVVGALLGPQGFGRLADSVPAIRFVTISDTERVAPFGDLGVVFLLFLLGLEFSASRLWSLRREVFGIGCLQVLFSGTALAMIAAALWDHASGVALVLGFAMALSSTAVVGQMLADRHLSLSPLGQMVIAVLLFQDIMVAPILLSAELLAAGGESGVLIAAVALAKAAGAVAVILVAGRFILAPLFAAAALTRSRELLMAITLTVVVGASALTQMAGLSSALGAFLSGMMLSETAYRHQIQVDLEPFKGLLVGVFFVTVGMSVDFAAILPMLPQVLGSTAILLVLKGTMSYLAARLLGAGVPVAAEAAALLSQTGEFAFVVLGLLSVRGLITPTEGSMLVAVVALSIAFTPLVARIGRHVGRRLADSTHEDLATPATAPRAAVVIGGFGRVGRMIARVLEAENVPFVALDTDPARVAQERAAGRPVFLGDAGRSEILERLGAEQARAFVVTLDAPKAAERMVMAVRHHWSSAAVIARAKDAHHARLLSALGITGAIPEAAEASLQLAARVLTALDLPEEEVAARIAAEREEVRRQIGQVAAGREVSP